MKYSEQIKRLKAIGACSTDYAEQFNSAQDAWDACEQPQDMLWLIGRLSGKPQSKERLRLIKFLVKNVRKTVLKHTKPNTIVRRELLKVLRIALKYYRQNKGVSVKALRYAAYAAYAAVPPTSNAVYAAVSSVVNAAASSASDTIFASASSVVYASASSVLYASASSVVRAKERLRWCKLIRKEWPKVPVITKKHLINT